MVSAFSAGSLLPDPQPLDQLRVVAEIPFFQIIQKMAPLTYEFKQAATRVMILLVDLEVFGQVAYSLTQDRDLHLSRPGVCPVRLIADNDLTLLLFR